MQACWHSHTGCCLLGPLKNHQNRVQLLSLLSREHQFPARTRPPALTAAFPPHNTPFLPGSSHAASNSHLLSAHCLPRIMAPHHPTPPQEQHKEMASRRRKEKRKHHLLGPRTNPSEGQATLLARGSGHPDPREARRAHRPGLPGVGRRRLGRRPRSHRRGNPEQHHLRSAPGRPASELPNPDGQNGLSGPPPPPSQLTAVHRRAPSAQARAALRRAYRGRHPSRSVPTEKRLPAPLAEVQTPPE